MGIIIGSCVAQEPSAVREQQQEVSTLSTPSPSSSTPWAMAQHHPGLVMGNSGDALPLLHQETRRASVPTMAMNGGSAPGRMGILVPRPAVPPGMTTFTHLLVPEIVHAPGQPPRIRRVLYGIKCPVCSKFVLPDDIECHLVMCLTKPRLVYNEDVLTEDKGECVICLEELLQGDTIARLPCLCIYHKTCIDQWFEVNRSCPEHPSD